MARQLELQFRTAEGKNKVIGIDQPVENVDPLVVQAAMEQIISQNMFEADGVTLYASIKGARYVTRTIEDILEVSE